MNEIFNPLTFNEALKIRGEKNALVFAGGTDLMVRYRAKNSMAPVIKGPVLFIDRIESLKKIDSAGGFLEIGAAVNLSVLAGDPGAEEADIPPLLKAAAGSIAAPALRNRATLAGNVANASPAGDGLCALVALDAQVVLASSGAERIITVYDFVTGPGKTELKNNEIIRAFRITEPLPEKYYWRKVGTRKANALTKVSLAASLWFEYSDSEKTGIRKCILAFGAVGPRIVKIDVTEILNRNSTELLSGNSLQEDLLNKVAAEIVSVSENRITPIDDQRSTAEYRKKVALNLIRDFMLKTFGSNNK